MLIGAVQSFGSTICSTGRYLVNTKVVLLIATTFPRRQLTVGNFDEYSIKTNIEISEVSRLIKHRN